MGGVEAFSGSYVLSSGQCVDSVVGALGAMRSEVLDGSRGSFL